VLIHSPAIPTDPAEKVYWDPAQTNADKVDSMPLRESIKQRLSDLRNHGHEEGSPKKKA
jgi:hypothetical protein